MKIGLVSGYFAPIHAGHIEYINAAKKESDFLIVIINNDQQVKLKQAKPFMDEGHRKIIVDNLKATDWSMIAIDQDLTVIETLKFIIAMFSIQCHSFTFFNSGDRTPNNINKKENCICQQYNIATKFLDLPKIYSSRNFRQA